MATAAAEEVNFSPFGQLFDQGLESVLLNIFKRLEPPGGRVILELSLSIGFSSQGRAKLSAFPRYCYCLSLP